MPLVDAVPLLEPAENDCSFTSVIFTPPNIKSWTLVTVKFDLRMV